MTNCRSPKLVAVPTHWRQHEDLIMQAFPELSILWVDPGELVSHELAPQVQGLVSHGFVPVQLLSLPELRAVSFSGTGVWNLIDLQLAQERGISVSNIRGYASSTIAEHVWALILATCKFILQADRSVRASEWPTPPWGNDLRGKTLGLVGVGTVGQHVAKIADAFGMTTIAWSAYRMSGETIPTELITFTSFEEVLQRSHILSLHARYYPGDRSLIGAEEFAMMRRGSVLINTARAGLVDTDALVAALTSGLLASAGLDVFDEEPLARDSALLRAPNTVFSPHISAGTSQAQQRAVLDCLDNLASFFEGRPQNQLFEMSGQ